VALSLLQSRKPQGRADGTAHSPFGLLGRPSCAGLPRPALLLGPRQHVAAPFTGELARKMWMQVHVIHLLSAVPILSAVPTGLCG
jgi:hypothetical protein